MESGSGEVDHRPLIERVVDKKWNTRNQAYLELIELFRNCLDDRIFDEYSSIMGQIANDSHANAFDTGLGTILEFADKAPGAKRITSDVAAKVIDKAFGARPSTADKGKAVLLKLIEIDTPDAACEVLLSQLSNKKPKIPPMCVQIIVEAISCFGGRAMPVKQLISQLPAMFESTNSGVRDKAMNLIVELARWVGTTPLQTTIDSLRSAQQSQFQSMIQEIEVGKPPLPTIGLRKDRAKLAQQQQAAAAAVASGGAVESKREEVVEAAMDPRDLVEEVDLIKRVRDSEYNRLIQESKWNEQMSGLQIIIDAIGPVPKLAAGDYGDIVHSLKTFINHSHVQLNTAAIKIVGLFADGLRGGFTAYVRALAALVIGKCKEKRLCGPIVECLQLVFKYSMAMEHVQEELVEHINGTVAQKKVPPHGRVCIMEVVDVVAKTAPQQISPPCALALVNALVGCLDDSDPKVREASCAAVTSFVAYGKRLGRKGSEVLAAIQQLQTKNARMFTKIMAANAAAPASVPISTVAQARASEPEEKVEIERKPAAATAPAAKPAAEAKKRSALPPSAGAKKAAPAKRSTPAGPSESKEPSRRPGASGGSKSSAKQEEQDDNVGEINMAPDTAQELMAELGVPNWESSVLGLLRSDKWNEKAEGLKAIEDRFKDSSVQAGRFSEALFVFLQGQFNAQLKITNVALFKSVLECIRGCVAACTAEFPFDKRVAAVLITICADKITDKKLAQLVQETFVVLSEALRPSFVCRRMMKITESAKAPAAHTTFLEWLSTAINDFGANMFPVQAIVKFCIEEMENKAAQVRTGAIAVLGQLFHQLGPPFSSLVFAEDLKPQLRTMIEAEFQRVGYDATAMKNSSRQTKDADGEAPAEGGSIIPRQDLMNLAGRDIIQRLNNNEGKTAWQIRKTAIEDIIAAAERASHYLEGSKAMAEVLKALRGRLSDSQSNLKPLAASAIAHIINSVDAPSVPKFVRVVAEGLLAGAADNKKQMRDAAIESLDKCVTVEGAIVPAAVDVLIPLLAAALANPGGRLELLTWFQKALDAVQCDASDLGPIFVTCMQDKTAATRAAAENCLSTLISKGRISRSSVEGAVRDLPPAARRSLEGPIERMFDGVAGGSTAAPSAVASTAAQPRSTTEAKSAKAAPSKLAKSQSVATRARAPSSSGLAAPTAREQADVKESSASDTTPLRPNQNKQRREEDLSRTNWPNPPEEPREAELATLRDVWSPLLSAPAISVLFPGNFGNMEMVLPGLSLLLEQLPSPVFVQHLDLVFRWLAIHLCERENVKAMQSLLEFINDMFIKLVETQYALTDIEANILLPYLIERGGSPKDRFRSLIKLSGTAVTQLYPAVKYVVLLVQGANSKNSRTKVFCLEEIQRVVPEKGLSALGKRGLKDIAPFADAREADVRNAALDALYEVYIQLDSDVGRLFKNLGSITDRAKTLIEDRIKEKNKHRDHSQPVPQPRMEQSAVPAYRSPEKMSGPYNLDFDSPIESPAGRRQSVSEAFDATMTEHFRNIEAMVLVEPPFTAEHVVYSAGKESLKMVYALIVDDEGGQSVFASVDGGLDRYVDRIVHVSVKCVYRAFATAPNDPNGVDSSVLSVALALLHTLSKDDAIVRRLSEQSLSVVFASLMSTVIDDRLTSGDEAVNTEIVRCMNVVMIRLSRSRPGRSLCCLVRLLLRCVKDADISEPPLAPKVGQILMRLMIRITTEELEKPNPFQSADCTLVEHLQALHYFEEHHPSHRPADDTPFSTVKTIAQYILSVGYDQVVAAMRLGGISPQSRLWRLIQKLHEPKSEAPVGVSNEVHMEVLALIEEIPSSVDKQATVQKLYALLQSHRELNVDHYLGRLSMTFQTYVREQLNRVARDQLGMDRRAAPRDENTGLSNPDALRQRMEAVRQRTAKPEAPLSTLASNVPQARAAMKLPPQNPSDPDVMDQVQGLFDRMQRISSKLKGAKPSRPAGSDASEAPGTPGAAAAKP